MINRLSNAISPALVGNNFLQNLANSMENFTSHEKKSVVTAQKLQSIKTLLFFKVCLSCKSGITFSSSEA